MRAPLSPTRAWLCCVVTFFFFCRLMRVIDFQAFEEEPMRPADDFQSGR